MVDKALRPVLCGLSYIYDIYRRAYARSPKGESPVPSGF